MYAYKYRRQRRIQDFPGGRQLPRGESTYDFAKFAQKLHEIERIWVPRGGGGTPLAPPLNPATGHVTDQ